MTGRTEGVSYILWNEKLFGKAYGICKNAVCGARLQTNGKKQLSCGIKIHFPLEFLFLV